MDAKGLIDNIRGIKNTDNDDYLLDKSKGNVTSALIGGGLGMLIAWKYKKNIFIGALIGGAIAGIATNIIVNRQS